MDSVCLVEPTALSIIMSGKVNYNNVQAVKSSVWPFLVPERKLLYFCVKKGNVQFGKTHILIYSYSAF